MEKSLADKLRKIKVLALDCDGVMTPLHIDTGIIMDLENAMKYEGRKFKYVVEIARFNHRDGQGIDLMKELGIKVLVITKQRSGYIEARCFKLGIPCLKVQDKLKGLNDWLSNEHPEVGLDEVCYIGDDVSDVPVLKAVGLGVAVADAVFEAKAVSSYTTKKNGGDCAVREVCDMILRA